MDATGVMFCQGTAPPRQHFEFGIERCYFQYDYFALNNTSLARISQLSCSFEGISNVLQSKLFQGVSGGPAGGRVPAL